MSKKRTQLGRAAEKSRRSTPVKSANATGGHPPRPTPSQAPSGEGVETGHGGTYRAIHGEGTVQTTNGPPPAAKAEVVGIIPWFWVRIPAGPLSSLDRN